MDGQFGQGLPLQTSQHSGFDMGDGQNFYQQQAAFAGQLGQTPMVGQDTNNVPRQPKVGDRLNNCHAIVYNGAEWVELRCYFCHVSTNSCKKFFENGCAGLRIHVRNQHKKEVTSDEDLIELCSHRVVPQQEIDSINKMVLKEGDAPPIAMSYMRRPSGGRGTHN
ncbi:hypothetical protein BDV97DRAFT_403139 [Delphinella strobiligena]|nr:hypothetical protein BDV97DRAFT_403139 [Delphinella strobiligena]